MEGCVRLLVNLHSRLRVIRDTQNRGSRPLRLKTIMIVFMQAAVLQVLEELQRRGVTILLSTHNLGLVGQRFPEVLLLNRRVIAFGGCQEVLVSGLLQQTFAGQWLLLPDGSLLAHPFCGDKALPR